MYWCTLAKVKRKWEYELLSEKIVNIWCIFARVYVFMYVTISNCIPIRYFTCPNWQNQIHTTDDIMSNFKQQQQTHAYTLDKSTAEQLQC